MAIRHFLTLLDLSPVELQTLIARAIELKQQQNKLNNSMQNRVLGMVFEKSSTRTRVSFEAGMAQMGGHAIFLSPRDTQLGRGEPVEDSARVLSRMVDIIMVRTFGQDIVERFAAHSRVPVINALTNSFHPCQLLADMMTFIELRGSLQGRTVAWIGDGYNMCQTYIHAAKQFGFHLNIACPAEYAPDKQLVAQFQDCVTVTSSPQEAVVGASLVATDVWASMGHEAQKEQRLQAFQPYQVTPVLMDHALPDALFMHCLPAHRGEEVSHAMMEDPRAESVWTEAENRLHVQKALIEFLLTPTSSA